MPGREVKDRAKRGMRQRLENHHSHPQAAYVTIALVSFYCFSLPDAYVIIGLQRFVVPSVISTHIRSPTGKYGLP